MGPLSFYVCFQTSCVQCLLIKRIDNLTGGFGSCIELGKDN